MRKKYTRVERITGITVTDHVVVNNETVMRDGSDQTETESYSVQWFNEDGTELPESSAIYNFLEAEFTKLTED